MDNIYSVGTSVRTRASSLGLDTEKVYRVMATEVREKEVTYILENDGNYLRVRHDSIELERVA